MGLVRHHTIVVTGLLDLPGWYTDGRDIRNAREAAQQAGLLVSDVVAGMVNGYATFMAAPDGSKEGWAESDDGDRRRAEFVGWLDDQRYDDGSSPFSWAELVVAPDEGCAYVSVSAWGTER